MLIKLVKFSWPLILFVAISVVVITRMRYAYIDGFYFRVLQGGHVLQIEGSPYILHEGHTITFMHHDQSNNGSIAFSFGSTYYYAMFDHFDGIIDVHFIQDSIFGDWIYNTRNVEAYSVTLGRFERNHSNVVLPEYTIPLPCVGFCYESSGIGMYELQRNALLQSSMIVHLRIQRLHSDLRNYLPLVFILMFVGYSLYISPTVSLRTVKKAINLAYSLCHASIINIKEYLMLSDSFVIKMAGMLILIIMLVMLFSLI